MLFGFGTDDCTHRGQLAAAIHALLDPTVADADVGAAFHAACPFHRGYRFRCGGAAIVNDAVSCPLVTGPFIAQAAAIHIAPDGTAVDGDGSILSNRTELTATIDVTLDDRRHEA